VREAELVGTGVGINEDGEARPLVEFRVGDRRVPVLISPRRAWPLRLIATEVPVERPLSHDLLVEMVTEFGGTIERVRIDDVSGETFYAKVDAERPRGEERERVAFDARATDAIAVALRVGCPIELSESVIAAAGVDPEAQPDDEGDGGE